MVFGIQSRKAGINPPCLTMDREECIYAQMFLVIFLFYLFLILLLTLHFSLLYFSSCSLGGWESISYTHLHCHLLSNRFYLSIIAVIIKLHKCMHFLSLVWMSSHKYRFQFLFISILLYTHSAINIFRFTSLPLWTLIDFSVEFKLHSRCLYLGN